MPQKALTGKELVAKINEVKHDRVALIEGFLYEKSVLMVAADPGAGKSVLIANVISSLSTGLFAFGNLYVPKPCKCYYIPFERSADEIMERFKHMQTTTMINYDNIFVNDSFIGMNVIDIHDAHKIIETIKEDCPDPDLIILDPIYAAVAGGLSTDDKASMFCRFSARLQHEFNCSIWMNHHTVKDTYSSFSGEKIGKSDPFYGSQWLKAHCTASYHMKADDSGNGVVLEIKKDSIGSLIERLSLGYNDEDYTQFARDIDSESTTDIKLKTFLRACKANKKTFTFAQIRGCVKGVSKSTIRRFLAHPDNTPKLKKLKNSGEATLYEILGDF
jgi:RecA-family ATPase